MRHLSRPGIFLAAGLLFACDRLTKYFAIKGLAAGQSIKIIPDFFHVTLVLNDGAAFGVLRGASFLFIIFSIIIIALILLIIFKNPAMDVMYALSAALVLAGASGNLVDRLKFGYVVDFLDFRIWPVFNIADSCISVGIVLTVFKFCLKKRK